MPLLAGRSVGLLPTAPGLPADPSHPAAGGSGEADSEEGLSASSAPTAGGPPPTACRDGGGEGLPGAGGGGRAASLAGDLNGLPLPLGSGRLPPEPADALMVAALHEDKDAAGGTAEEEEWPAYDDPAALLAPVGLDAKARDGGVQKRAERARPSQHDRHHYSTAVEVEDGEGMEVCFESATQPPVAIDPALAMMAAGAGQADSDPEAAGEQGESASSYPIPDARVAALIEVYLRCTLQVRARGLDEADG